jgi:hypothetical protein
MSAAHANTNALSTPTDLKLCHLQSNQRVSII